MSPSSVYRYSNQVNKVQGMSLARPTRLQVCHKDSEELASITWIDLRIKIAVEGVNENALRPLALSPYIPISTLSAH